MGAAESAFGQYLKANRLRAKLTLRGVADAVGMTHVYLGEIERGMKPPPKHEWWPLLARVIPGVTMEGLERNAAVSRPLQLDLSDAPGAVQDLALELARRIESQDLAEDEARDLLRILGQGERRRP